jgi:periplasmic protein TonB
VSAIAAPRLTGGVIASIGFHGALFAALVFALRPATAPPAPPLYQVKIFAAPPGERRIGVVQDRPLPPLATPTPTAPTTPTPTKVAAPPKPKPIAPAPTTKPAAKPKPRPPAAATPVDPQASKASPSTAAAPKAGGGDRGGKGADVANVDTPGIEFPYPYYTNNIVRQLLLQFGQSSANFTAEVRFVIRRDGSVDPQSIKLVSSNGNYSFNSRALGAVEAAANAKAFGPLPPGFSEDILPVTFRFSPQSR